MEYRMGSYKNERMLCHNHWRDQDKIWVQGVPKKSALGKHLNIATHGFKMCILYFKKDKLGPNPSRPLKGHP